MDLDYRETLITVAPDCPVAESEEPRRHGGRPTIATIQYELLADHPYQHTQKDVLFHTWLSRQDFEEAPTAREEKDLRERFFARSQACLRASPLPKRYGFGLHFDASGRIALCPMESERYRKYAADEDVTVMAALRSKR